MRILSLSALLFLLGCPQDVGVVKNEIDNDNDGYNAEVDCDDGRADINPEADEVCDGEDNDCDGEVDVGASDALTFYADADADTFGDLARTETGCEAPAGYVTNSEDCDDTLAAAFPGNPEVCDGIDNDCDGTIDDNPSDLATFYGDADDDGYGEASDTVDACEAPEGYVGDATDCDDGNAAIHPDAAEADCADPTDYNCDGSVGYADADGDGVAACEDCDDTDAGRSPLLTEECDELDTDEDCDGTADDADDSTDAASMSTYTRDADRDGYSTGSGTSFTQCEDLAGYSATAGDCDDYDSTVNPAATEVCDVFDTDEDCDGLTEDDDPSVDASTFVDYHRDADGDGYGDASRSVALCEAPANYVADATDCDDTDDERNPGEAEVCDSADKDEDCDGLSDDADTDTVGASTWYTDADGDTYGDAGSTVRACEQPADTVSNDDDCDDGAASVHPGATEVCDSANTDEDCDGDADDDDSGVSSSGKSTFYADSDTDGYGSASSTVSRCDAPSGYTTTSTDCDDSRAAVNPAATESCSTTYDDDCDGTANETGASGCTTYYYDGDNDGYGLLTASQCACSASGNYDVTGVTSANDDCDDSSSSISPAGTEVCDSADTDEDCDGYADDSDTGASGKSTVYADSDGDGFGSTTGGASYCDAPAGYASNSTDCDDADADTFPGAAPSDSASACMNDDDNDGYGDTTAPSGGSAGTDCSDSSSGVNPGATETCSTTADDDCDGSSNDLNATGCTTYYYDGDNDGYGLLATYQCTCTSTGSYDVTGVSASNDDCNDASTSVSPGVTEVCSNSVDDDCDGSTDEGCATAIYSGDYEAEYASTGSTEADAMIYGEATSDYFGAQVLSGLDLDDDGYDNVVVGAEGNNYTSSYYGSFYVYDGFPTGSADADTNDVARVYGSSGSTYAMPANLWKLEDFNGDGDDELAVLYASSTLEYVYLYKGATFGGTFSYSSSTHYYDYLSATGPVSGLGDENTTSGNNEIGIGDWDASSDQGAVYIYGYGTSALSALYTINGEDASDYAGHGLAGYEGNDVNGDGYDDIFIGAHGDDTGGSDAGAAYVVEAPVTATFDLSGAQVKIAGAAGDYLGYHVGAPGDVDGDGTPDLFASAPYDDDGATSSGVVFVFADVNTDGATKDNDSTDYEVKIMGANANDYLGIHDTEFGDVNGDGEIDVLLGSAAYDPGSTTNGGAAWLIYGPLSGSYDLGSSSGYDARFLGNDSSDSCGADVALGDLDADGNDDIMMGCTNGDKEGYVNYGTVYFFAGG